MNEDLKRVAALAGALKSFFGTMLVSFAALPAFSEIRTGAPFAAIALATFAADLPPLPKAKCPDAATLEINAGRMIKFEISAVGESRYVDATVTPKDGVADFELPF